MDKVLLMTCPHIFWPKHFYYITFHAKYFVKLPRLRTLNLHKLYNLNRDLSEIYLQVLLSDYCEVTQKTEGWFTMYSSKQHMVSISRHNQNLSSIPISPSAGSNLSRNTIDSVLPGPGHFTVTSWIQTMHRENVCKEWQGRNKEGCDRGILQFSLLVTQINYKLTARLLKPFSVPMGQENIAEAEREETQ